MGIEDDLERTTQLVIENNHVLHELKEKLDQLSKRDQPPEPKVDLKPCEDRPEKITQC